MRAGDVSTYPGFLMKASRHILLVFVSLSLFSCNEKLADNPLVNRKPSSFLWLYPDSTVGVGVSRQHLRWWGEDPDGVIRGYLFGFLPVGASQIPDTARYSWVSRNDTLIQFQLDTLNRDTTSLLWHYTVFVRAVDNTFGGLPEHSVVRLTPTPYVDNNNDGVFNAGDLPLPELEGAMDPVGASLVFPLRNTPPTIALADNPNSPGSALVLPAYTYTAVSIGFKGADADGDNTLAHYRIAVNDTTTWLNLRLRDTLVTLVVPRARSDAAPNIPGAEVTADVYSGTFIGRQLVGQVPGLRLDATNVIYVQVRDVAGDFSPVLRIPGAAQATWFVKRPRGRLLLFQDYTRADSALARSTYVDALHAIPDPLFATIDEYNITPPGFSISEKQAGRLSTNVPPYVDPSLIYTFLLYDYVFMWADGIPSLRVIQSVPFYYLQNGGKMLLSMTFFDDFTQVNPTAILREFAPIDSVASAFLAGTPPSPRPGDNRLWGATKLYPDSSVAANIYPQLAFNGTRLTIHGNIFWRDMYRRTDARVIYRLEPDSVCYRMPPPDTLFCPKPNIRYRAVDPNGQDTLRPKVAIVDGQGTIVVFGLPIHLLNNTDGGNRGVAALFTKMFTQQFNPHHRVNRRKF